MKPARLALFLCILLCFMAGHSAVKAVDLGVDGTIWPIAEPDLLQSIKTQLQQAESDGRLQKFNANVQNQITQAFDAPHSLSLQRTANARKWIIDPSVILEKDIYAPNGILIAAKGEKINPLTHVKLRQSLLFIDGRDEEQILWAMEQIDAQTPFKPKIILTSGQPAKLMEKLSYRLFYDQKAVLVKRFGIQSVPAKITQDDLLLLGEEIYLPAPKKETGNV